MTRAGVLEFVLSSSPTYSALICLSLFPSGGEGVCVLLVLLLWSLLVVCVCILFPPKVIGLFREGALKKKSELISKDYISA